MAQAIVAAQSPIAQVPPAYHGRQRLDGCHDHLLVLLRFLGCACQDLAIRLDSCHDHFLVLLHFLSCVSVAPLWVCHGKHDRTVGSATLLLPLGGRRTMLVVRRSARKEFVVK